MRTIETKIYKFGELKEEIKEKVIKVVKKDIEEEYCKYWLKEDMEEKAKELLKKYFGDDAWLREVYYDLSYSQGSGAMVAFELKYYNLDLNIFNTGRYCHERVFGIEECYYNKFELSFKREEKLREKIIKMNEELTKFGHEQIEHFRNVSIEEIETYCNDTELEFTENGEIYCWETNLLKTEEFIVGKQLEYFKRS